MNRTYLTAPMVIASLMISACQSSVPTQQPNVQGRGNPTYQNTSCLNCGVVQSIDKVRVDGSASALGTVGGAIVGGILGSQVGGGNGKTIATVGGAVAGGVVGRELEKRQGTRDVWHVNVRMSNGTTRTISLDVEPQLRVGEAVSVD
jgi:outer membrane lipoprotein SlyB